MIELQKVRLGDICKFQNGYAFKSKDFIRDGQYNVVKIKELKNGKVKFFEDTATIDLNIDEYENYSILKGDVLFALTGDPVNKNNPLSWVGRVAIYKEDNVCLLNQRVCKVITVEDKILKEYVYYYFRVFENFYSLAAKATGSASQANISTKTIADTEMMIPSIETQKKIVKLLSAFDDKIDNNNQINGNLEQQAQAMFQSLFIENADSDWPLGTLSDLGIVIGGSTPSKAKPEYYTSNGIAWITPKDLSNNKSKFISHGENDITVLGLKNSSASIMPKGTILFSSRAPIGYIAIAAGEVTTNQGFKSIIPHPHIGSAFVYYFLKNNLPIIENMASGSTFKEVSGSIMKSIPAQIPRAEILEQFTDFCAPLFAHQEQLELENLILATMRDSLLPNLMSGKLDVSEINI